MVCFSVSLYYDVIINTYQKDTPAKGYNEEYQFYSMAVIPEPKGIPILGNLLDIDQELPIGSFVSLADQYGKTKRLDHHLL